MEVRGGEHRAGCAGENHSRGSMDGASAVEAASWWED